MSSRTVVSLIALITTLAMARSVAATETIATLINCEDATVEAMDSAETPAAQIQALGELAGVCAGSGAYEAALGNAYIYTGRPDEAERLVRDALAQETGYEKQLRGVLGDALFRQEKFDEAESLARALIEDYPDFYIGYWRLGDVLLVTGDDKGVVAALETANRLEENSVSYQLLTMAHFNLRNYQESVRALHTSLEMDIAGLRHTPSISTGALSLLAIGQYDTGRELLDRHIELVPDAVNEDVYQFAIQHFQRAEQQR